MLKNYVLLTRLIGLAVSQSFQSFNSMHGDAQNYLYIQSWVNYVNVTMCLSLMKEMD